MSFRFKKNVANQYIYMVGNGGSFMILVLHVDDILLASNDENRLIKIKQMLLNILI